MNQSIYTEYSNLTPDEIQWLDGCGETSPLGRKASEITPTSNHGAFILVSAFDPHGANQYFACGEMEHCKSKNYTHILTGSQFCERVAETKLAELEDLFYFQEIIDKGNHDSDNLEEGFESEFYDNLDNQISQKLETIRAQAIANSKVRSKS